MTAGSQLQGDNGQLDDAESSDEAESFASAEDLDDMDGKHVSPYMFPQCSPVIRSWFGYGPPR